MSSEAVVETFSELGLDTRLVKALSKEALTKPTMIQSTAIPFAMQGKDILAKAKTGSGKTLAYLLPVLHRMLTEDVKKALILVPSRDLAKQVQDALKMAMQYCPQEMQAVNLANEDSVHLQKSMLSTTGNKLLIISTPGRLLAHLEAVKDASMMVIDEADLILGFGYGPDMEQICSVLPPTLHSLLMSASISAEVDQLKQLVLRNAVVLRLEDEVDEQEHLKQFTISCSPDDKFLLIYVILKLKLLRGKILVFVNDVDKGYRLKLFLEQFAIRSCVVNTELPLASRHHIVEEFNRGVYDLLIASDSAVQIQETKGEKASAKKGSKKGKTEDNGMARGIDFKRIDVVLNFDFPQRVDSYIHRVGRTARAGQQGTAISFVAPEDELVNEMVRRDVKERTEKDLEPYAFDLVQIEGFRYRCQDAMRSVTGAMVKEARLKDLKQELVNSERLKTFFADRPKDLEILKHDKGLLSAGKIKPHLKHVPDYLVKKRRRTGEDAEEEVAGGLQALPQTEPAQSNRQKKIRAGRTSAKNSKKDPLKSIKTSRR